MVIALAMVMVSAPSASAELILILDKKQIELGHYIRAELYGIDLPQKLKDIDFSDIEPSFGIVIDETVEQVEDERWPNQSIQLLEMRLYPRKIGALTIPSLELEGIYSPPELIQVVDGIDTKSAIIKQQTMISSTTVWQRQRVSVIVEITTQEPFVSLQTEETLAIKSFEVYPISATTEKIQSDGLRHFILRIGWVLFPLLDGDYVLDLPAIEYIQSGQILRNYFLPRKKLTIKALPPYIPPTMPVGKIQLSSVFRSEGLLYPEKLSYWELRIKGIDVSPNWVPMLLSQIKQSRAIKTFKPITELKMQQNTSVKESSLQSEIWHQIPFKAIASGRVQFPTLQLQYFDPSSSKIVDVRHQVPFLLALSLPWRIIIGGFIGALLLWLSAKSFVRLTKIVRRMRHRRIVLMELAKAHSTSALRHSLRQFSKLEGWQENTTLREWQQRFQIKYRKGNNLSLLMLQLTQASYSSDSRLDIERFRAALVAELRPRNFRQIMLGCFT